MADADLPDAVPSLDSATRRQLIVRRLLQFTVDVVLMLLVCLAPLGALWLLLPRAPDGTLRLLTGLLAFCLAVVLCVAVAVAYWVWLPARSRVDRLGGRGQTPAMRWFRLRVTDQGGGDPTAAQLAVRWLMLLVDGIAFGLVGVAAMSLTPRGQRVGDLMAGTVVVSERRHRPLTPGPRSARQRRARPAGRLD